jgi:translation initiation factor 1
MSSEASRSALDADFDDNDVEEVKSSIVGGSGGEIHIRMQQRNGRKSLTIIEGLPPKLNLKKVLSHFKREFCSNGKIVSAEKSEKILKLSGDQRNNVGDFLTDQKLARKEQIKIHGF